jgi:hypothetical protein
MSEEDEILIGGLIALGIGFAYLIYYFTEGRRVEAKWLEQDLANENSKRITQSR